MNHDRLSMYDQANHEIGAMSVPTHKRALRKRLGLTAPKCSARRRDGVPCQAYAIAGSTVCRVHGGSAPQVRAAAARRLENMLVAAVDRLGEFAFDDDMPPAVALAAVNSILDRCGFTSKQLLEIDLGGPKPWEEMLQGIATITRAESYARRGIELSPGGPGTPALAGPTPTQGPPEIVDAEVIPDPPETAADSPPDRRTYPPRYDDLPAPPQRLEGLVSLEEAVAETTTHTRVKRVTRRYR